MGQTIKVSTVKAVEVTAFHKDVYAVCKTGLNGQQTMRAKLAALLITKYGQPVIGKDAEGKETRSGGPAFDAYRADNAALRQLAANASPIKGGDVGQYVRKMFAWSVNALYGSLPESQDAAAVLKRAQRDAKAAAKKATNPAAPVGAPSGETQEREPSESETIEAAITRMGLIKTMHGCFNILKADDKTKAQAVHFEKMLAKLARDLATV